MDPKFIKDDESWECGYGCISCATVSVNGFTATCLKRTEIRATLFLTLDGNKKERQEQILNEGENEIETFTSLQSLSNRCMSILCQI